MMEESHQIGSHYKAFCMNADTMSCDIRDSIFETLPRSSSKPFVIVARRLNNVSRSWIRYAGLYIYFSHFDTNDCLMQLMIKKDYLCTDKLFSLLLLDLQLYFFVL
jgi:hypothetical protein